MDAGKCCHRAPLPWTIIANPGSYFYFSDDRPGPDGSLAPFPAASCLRFNHWRYGPRIRPR
jgi:hypothetical protein